MQNDEKKALFDQLITSELSKMRAMSYRILENVTDVDDAIQEALVKAWRHFDAFQGKNHASLSSWVCRIVINSSYDLLRGRCRANTVYDRETQLADTDPTSPLNQIPEEISSQGSSSSQMDIQQAIALLPIPYREAITLVLEYDHKTAAQMLGISRNTLDQRIFKAKKMLKNILSDSEE